mmetsp:Transcript_23201/g.33715  ORF Transcript_23201/g.33715 Transcript_23201/m.33715 type:complete len:228 (+) Transcript_23201:117-800(+)
MVRLTAKLRYFCDLGLLVSICLIWGVKVSQGFTWTSVRHQVQTCPVCSPVHINPSTTALSVARKGQRSKATDSKRQSRVAELIRSEISQIFLRGSLKQHAPIPEALRKKIAVVDVSMSPDVRSANVFVSIYGEPKEKRLAFAWILKHTKSIRHSLSQSLKDMRGVPNLFFRQVDVGAAVDVMSLIDSISKTSSSSIKEQSTIPSGMIDGLDFEFEDDEDDDDDILGK